MPVVRSPEQTGPVGRSPHPDGREDLFASMVEAVTLQGGLPDCQAGSHRPSALCGERLRCVILAEKLSVQESVRWR